MVHYPKSHTAILLVDPYNDFISSRGQLWPLLRTVAKQVDLLKNLKVLLETGRELNLPIVFAPHQRYRPGNYQHLKFLSPSQAGINLVKTFKASGFGGQFHKDFQPQDSDIVSTEHACTSGFGGTDLHQKLQQKQITHLVIVGLLSNTCIESTARSAVDLDYHVTLLTDGVATWTPEDQRAATESSYQHIGHQVMSTAAFLQVIREEHQLV